MSTSAQTDIDQYISSAAPESREYLKSIRQIVHEEAPDAVETIKYQIPTFVLHGNLVHFAAYKKHIGIYPPVRDPALKAEVAKYEGEKGALRFSLNEPMPLELIRRIVKARVMESRMNSDSQNVSGQK